MDGPEHYQRSEALLASIQLASMEDENPDGVVVEHYPAGTDDAAALTLAAAQVHATLALTAATARRGGLAQAVKWQEVTT